MRKAGKSQSYRDTVFEELVVFRFPEWNSIVLQNIGLEDTKMRVQTEISCEKFYLSIGFLMCPCGVEFRIVEIAALE